MDSPFWMGETEVTYELWYAVRVWAEANRYRFAKKGGEGGRLGGSDGREPSDSRHHPATRMGWYDAVVWCNALSEMLSLDPVYTYQGRVYRDATNRTAGNNLTTREVVGFRLPTRAEWELAARYRGRERSRGAIQYPRGSRLYWSPGIYASGATGAHTDDQATGAVAWYQENSEVDGRGLHTHPVGRKRPNALNLYDMSGNVSEWLHSPPGERAGGSYWNEALSQQIGLQKESVPGQTYWNVGLRVVLSVKIGEAEDLREDEEETALFPVTSLVEVRSDGKWYPAQVLAFEKGNYYITYSGYDSSWDEWVDATRIRKRSQTPVIASVEALRIAVELGTSLAEVPLPERVEVGLRDRSTFVCEVDWDTESYDRSMVGEYVLKGELTGLPVNVTNPGNVTATITVRVREAGAHTAVVRKGAGTKVEGLQFYIEQDEGLSAFYFGQDPDRLTHMVVENSRGFMFMIVYNAKSYPVQWVLPRANIAVMLRRNQAFDPKEALLSFVLEGENRTATFDIELADTVDRVLDSIPREYSRQAAAVRETLRSRGWLSLTVAEVADLAATPHERAFATFLSTANVRMRILDQIAAVEGASPVTPGIRFVSAGGSDKTPLEKLRGFLRELGENLSMTFAILSYLERIASGYYDGQDITGPAVHMLVCRGASSEPGVCHHFYLPRPNLSLCIQVCKTSLGCFTDICHPMVFSMEDANRLLRPFD